MMRIPYVIDNVEHRLADILNDLLSEQPGREQDIATACFRVRGFGQVRETLPGVRHFRLLLGDQPADGVEVGYSPPLRLVTANGPTRASVLAICLQTVLSCT